MGTFGSYYINYTFGIIADVVCIPGQAEEKSPNGTGTPPKSYDAAKGAASPGVLAERGNPPTDEEFVRNKQKTSFQQQT